jgi:hypothetical protein
VGAVHIIIHVEFAGSAEVGFAINFGHVQWAADASPVPCTLVRLDFAIAWPYFRTMTLLRERITRRGIGAVEPCLPSPAKESPSGPGWVHDIKHDGFRVIARRNMAGSVRLVTRKGACTKDVMLPARLWGNSEQKDGSEQNGLSGRAGVSYEAFESDKGAEEHGRRSDPHSIRRRRASSTPQARGGLGTGAKRSRGATPKLGK